MTATRIVSGTEAVKAARALARQQSNRDLWPYVDAYSPPDAERVHIEGSIVAPAVATQTIVTSYTVDNGFDFIFTDLIQIYNGAGFVVGASSITWVLDVNQPLGTGIPQGYPVQGFGVSSLPKGGLQIGLFAPYKLEKPELLGPLDTLRSKVTITNAITPGAPNYFITIFGGWKVPHGSIR